ncbi:hypothetical protein CAP35_06740 [Chitinophagaceae bacterium IBVUCB1]|nr:hypothetical protein CAP35_06740 [Chitinophagaceae bacterium IBVUCB1]
MSKLYSLAATLLFPCMAWAQTNMLSTNAIAEQVMLGNYNPASYAAANVIANPATISADISNRISTDSLLAYLHGLRSFKNRNTGSDTISATKGIGAARRWVYNKFQQFSTQNDNRLVVSYLQFDLDICGITRHSNVMAVLPGSDTTDKSIVIIEAHIDSRCAGLCDTSCVAEGMEDNGSGTALVMELARVMSKYTFKNTIVFVAITGEEQGLAGAEAFADYAVQKGIKIKAVLNNDVIGGVLCGKTSSPPSCPGFNEVDSTHVRLFSFGGFNSMHKQLARYIKLEYKEMLLPTAAIPMGIHIMTDEDRTGRGGDHIPFRRNGFAAMRFTSANEHGNADVTAAGYDDRQHTSDDILGVDTNGDTIIDSLFVNLRYLARNATINGNATAMAAQGVKTPSFNFTYLPSQGSNDISISITDAIGYGSYRVAVRSTGNDWDSVYTFSTKLCTIPNLPQTNNIVSIAAVDANGIESLFSGEQMGKLSVNNTLANDNNIELLQNIPNPFDEKTMISVRVQQAFTYSKAHISITDLQGRTIKQLPIQLKAGINEVIYEHGYNATGVYTYTLVVDGKPLQTNRMVFAN